MGVYRICKWEVLFMGIFMGSNLSLRRGGGGLGGAPPRKFKNMKCSRSDSRSMLGLLRVSS